jgi:hypothetical protein
VAQPHDHPGRLRLGGDPFGPDHLGEQLDRLALLQDREHDLVGGLIEFLELAPAGDQRGRARALRQQRPHLRGVGGVVQHDQDLPVGQPVVVPLDPLVEPLGDGVPGHTELEEQLPEHLARRRRLALGTPQVDVELAVGERPADPVGEAGDERRLAHPGLARDRRHHRVRPGVLECVLEPPDVVVAPGEVLDIRRQPVEPGPHAGRDGGCELPRHDRSMPGLAAEWNGLTRTRSRADPLHPHPPPQWVDNDDKS